MHAVYPLLQVQIVDGHASQVDKKATLKSASILNNGAQLCPTGELEMIYTVKRGQVTFGQAIGIIMMDTFMPFPPGTPGNATTFSYPVRYELVRGAVMQAVVYEPDGSLLEPMLEAGRRLVKAGVRAVTGNCGFMILYQEALARERIGA